GWPARRTVAAGARQPRPRAPRPRRRWSAGRTARDRAPPAPAPRRARGWWRRDRSRRRRRRRPGRRDRPPSRARCAATRWPRPVPGCPPPLGVARPSAPRLLGRGPVGGGEATGSGAIGGGRIGTHAEGAGRHVLDADGDLHGPMIVPGGVRNALVAGRLRRAP